MEELHNLPLNTHEIEQLRRELLNRSLQWIECNLKRFDPLNHESGLKTIREKAIVELSLAAYLLRKGRQQDTAARAEVLLDHVSVITGTPSFRNRLFEAPETLVAFTFLGAIMHLTGRNPAFSRAQLQRLVDRGFDTARERIPFRQMELRFALDLYGIQSRLVPSLSDAYCGTSARLVCRNRLSEIYISNDDLYSITHTVFYMTKFGEQPPTGRFGKDSQHLCLLLDRFIPVLIHERHWDLLCESLMSLQMLVRNYTSQNYQFAIQVLHKQQEGDGSISGPTLSLPNAGRQDVQITEDELFDYNYHTVLVCLLAAGIRYE